MSYFNGKLNFETKSHFENSKIRKQYTPLIKVHALKN
jgi:hypothetical protein